MLESPNVGDSVITTSHVGGESVGSYSSYRNVPAGTVGVITRVATTSVVVRFEDYAAEPFSIWVNIAYLNATDRVARGDGRRKLGTKPEGDEYLSPNDPRLEWFWDDVSTIANASSYCNEFDLVIRKLGLPPRKREYTARGNLGSFELTRTYLARSQADANKMLADDLEKDLAALVGSAQATATN